MQVLIVFVKGLNIVYHVIAEQLKNDAMSILRCYSALYSADSIVTFMVQKNYNGAIMRYLEPWYLLIKGVSIWILKKNDLFSQKGLKKDFKKWYLLKFTVMQK